MVVLNIVQIKLGCRCERLLQRLVVRMWTGTRKRGTGKRGTDKGKKLNIT